MKFKEFVETLEFNNTPSVSTHLTGDLHKHVLGGYLDDVDQYTVLRVSKVEDFDIAKMLNVDLRYDNDFAL